MTIYLNDNDMRSDFRRSSKGNQYKWYKDGKWFKADYCGYEGLSEYVVSRLLDHSNLADMQGKEVDDRITTPKNDPTAYIHYDTIEIEYKDLVFTGCQSGDFLAHGEQLITLERLHRIQYGSSLTETIYHFDDHSARLKYIVDFVESATGIKYFGQFMCMLLTIDALFLNEDRHLHNIAVISGIKGDYRLSPVFDNGACLLSDTSLDYPLTSDIYEAIDSVRSKTFCESFTEQLDIAEDLYGSCVRFDFSIKDIMAILDHEPHYSKELKERVLTVITEQRRKYLYLFE